MTGCRHAPLLAGRRVHRPAHVRQPAGGRARRRRPDRRAAGGDRELDQPQRDDLPAASRRTRTPTTGCGSSPPRASCRSPGTPRSGRRTRGRPPAASRGIRARIVQQCAIGLVPVRGRRPAAGLRGAAAAALGSGVGRGPRRADPLPGRRRERRAGRAVGRQRSRLGRCAAAGRRDRPRRPAHASVSAAGCRDHRDLSAGGGVRRGGARPVRGRRQSGRGSGHRQSERLPRAVADRHGSAAVGVRGVSGHRARAARAGAREQRRARRCGWAARCPPGCRARSRSDPDEAGAGRLRARTPAGAGVLGRRAVRERPVRPPRRPRRRAHPGQRPRLPRRDGQSELDRGRLAERDHLRDRVRLRRRDARHQRPASL